MQGLRWERRWRVEERQGRFRCAIAYDTSVGEGFGSYLYCCISSSQLSPCISYTYSMNMICIGLALGFTVGRANPSSYSHCTAFSTTIIMSNERPSKDNRKDKIAQYFKRKVSSLLHLSRPPTASSIDMDSSSDKYMATSAAGTR